jgi:TonB family protein
MAKRRFSIASIGTVLLAGSLLAKCETPAEIGARLKASVERESLANVDARPWHLKLDVTLYDDDGKKPETGTIEIWRSGEDRRIVYEFGGKRYTRLELSGKSYRPIADVDVPYRAMEVVETVLRTGPAASEIDRSTPELRKQKFGKTSLDCIMLSQSHAMPYSRSFPAPLGMFPTYCLDPINDNIVARYDYGGELVDFKSLGKFLEHVVPTKFDIYEGKIVVANASLSQLSTFTPSSDEFTPTPDLKPGGYYALISSGIIAGNKIAGPTPVYPESAKQSHIGGTVVLRAIIGRDGHIHSLQPKASPDPDLTVAAMEAVRRWTYKPYLLNCDPVEVDTTITVNFNLNGGAPLMRR